MTQIFNDEGELVPVTVLEVGPCPVVQVKHDEEGVCTAVQIGFGDCKRKNTTSPLRGHFDKAGVEPKKILCDVLPGKDAELEPGEELDVSVFEETELVDVTGTSKGRGFAGVVRRHNFGGAPASHGGKKLRSAGSIGPGTDPGHVIKGRRMAGHMGCEKVTMRNLKLVKIDHEKNLLLVKGSVPGNKGNYVTVQKVESSADNA